VTIEALASARADGKSKASLLDVPTEKQTLLRRGPFEAVSARAINVIDVSTQHMACKITTAHRDQVDNAKPDCVFM
jgi:hypothetical protein